MTNNINFFGKESFPLEMHKVRIVQKLTLPPIETRLAAMKEAGNNTFLLKNKDVFLDMITDSGVNAMSDRQLASMMEADDSYAGSASFDKLQEATRDIFKKKFILPVHQGRAAENIISQTLIKQGDVVPMNYHFTTTKAHIQRNGGQVLELFSPQAMDITSTENFKGNMDIKSLEKVLTEEKGNIPFVRMEAGTNLIGGQPWSLQNLKEVSALCRSHGVPLVLDASLLADNLYFIKTREESQRDRSIKDITQDIAEASDIIYFSARKLGCARGGAILTSDEKLFDKMKELIPLYEGFLTYGGISVREIEAMTVGLHETMDFDMIRQGPEFINFMVQELVTRKIPVLTPAGGLGCHLDAKEFLPHVRGEQFTAGALACALYITSGVRGMERGTLSEERNPDGTEHISAVELVRLALPRRVFTMSQIKYAVDRIHWLFENKDLIGGLRWKNEPRILRFFTGTLEPISDWQENLVKKFRTDFGDSL